MKYNLLIINSNNFCDYFDGESDGIKFFGLSEEEKDKLMNLSLKHDFSVVVEKYGEEE